MLAGKKVLVVMPAYNAAQTLEPTFKDIPFDVVDEVLLVDDASHDETVAVPAASASGAFCMSGTWATAATKKPATLRP
jgi:hypothetical protein